MAPLIQVISVKVRLLGKVLSNGLMDKSTVDHSSREKCTEWVSLNMISVPINSKMKAMKVSSTLTQEKEMESLPKRMAIFIKESLRTINLMVQLKYSFRMVIIMLVK